MGQRIGRWVLLILLLCVGCGKTQEKAEVPDTASTAERPEETPQEAPEAPSEVSPARKPEILKTEDSVLLTFETTVDGNRVLQLDAVGKAFPTDYGTVSYGIREVRVYEGDVLLQTVLSQEAMEVEWGDFMMAEDGTYYTKCWSAEEVMSVQDMNFDSSGDIGLFGWIPNNSIPYYYWLWDSDTGTYRYAFTLQQAEPNPETQEVSSWYKYENGIYHTDYYQYDNAGTLTLARREVEDWLRGTGEAPLWETYEIIDGQPRLIETEEPHG